MPVSRCTWSCCSLFYLFNVGEYNWKYSPLKLVLTTDKANWNDRVSWSPICQTYTHIWDLYLPTQLRHWYKPSLKVNVSVEGHVSETLLLNVSGNLGWYQTMNHQCCRWATEPWDIICLQCITTTANIGALIKIKCCTCFLIL